MADTNFVDATATVPGTLIVASWLDDVNTNTYTVLTSVSGTNAIVATGPSTLSAYQRGVAMRLLPVNANTGAVTININGLGVRDITKYGTTPLVAGDLGVGDFAIIMYDGTQFQLINPGVVDVAHGGTGATTAAQALLNLGATGRLVGVQVFTASGTYTPNPLATRIYVRGQGSGGAGGGVGAVVAGTVAIGGGGGAGAYGEAFITSGFTPTVAVTIGAAGAGVAGATGGAGGASSFGAFLTLGGGGGGIIGASAAVSVASGGAGGVAGGSALVNASAAEHGDAAASSFAAGWANSGKGASTLWGAGGQNAVTGGPTGGGAAASGRGAGGGGAAGVAAGAAAAGGAGSAGVIVVFEFS